MNIEDFYKQKEATKITNEINQESTYYKDITAHSNLAYASGYIACMKCMPKGEKEVIKVFGFKPRCSCEKDICGYRDKDYRCCNADGQYGCPLNFNSLSFEEQCREVLK